MNDNPPNNVSSSATNSVSNSAAPLDEELVAYLDGELDAESGRRIEALLASDPAVRQRLHSLERAWDLLDELDAAPLGEPFTQTTLEMVAIAAREDAEQSRAEAPRRRRRRRLALGAILLAAAAAGFLAVALHDPDRRLLQDLPVIENLDEYRQIGSIEFLHRLRDERLPFLNAADPSKGSPAGDESVASRRQRVESMSLDEKEQLLLAEDRFTSLAPADRQRLRRLYEDLRNDPDTERLRAIMHGYYEWLKPLPPLTWAVLAEEEPEQRIASVKKRLQEEQRREGGRRPGGKDMAALRNWMDESAARHEPDFLKSLTADQRKTFSESGKRLQQQAASRYLWQRWLAPNAGKLPPPMTDEDLSRLREKLSPETRKRLEDKTPVEQWRLVAGWLRQGMRRMFEDRRLRGPLSKSDDEHLAEFFEKVLNDEQRDRLLSMPGEEMQGELQRLYLMHTRSSEGPGWRNRRPGDPDRPPPGMPGPMPRLPPPE